MAASDKGHFTEEEILEKVFTLNFMIKHNQWKELTKLVQTDLGTILIE